MSCWPRVCPVDQCEELCMSLRSYVSHIRCTHQFTSNLCLKCPMDGCSSQFTNSDSFRRHVEWRHREEYRVRSIAQHEDVRVGDIPISEEETMQVDDPGIAAPMCVSSSTQYESFMREISLRSSTLRLQIEHKFNLPTSVARNVYDEALQFAINMCQDLTGIVTTRIKEVNVNDKLLELMLPSPELEGMCKSTPATSLATLEHLGLVKPVEVDLLDLADRLGKPQANPLLNGKRPKMHYVPILETIKSFLSHPDVMQSVLRENSSSTHIRSFRDGEIYKGHPLFQVESNALRLTLYTDELELCNPIGGNNVKHKICCVYFQVTNIGTKHLSSLQTIHLALLVKDSFKKQFGYDVVLKLLIDDLKVLATDGVSVSLRGGGRYHFRGAVATFLGDNLSAHHLGGFRRTFSSGKVCRWCMADYGGLSTISSERECTLRTEFTMRRHASLVAQDPRLEALYGIKGATILSEIPYFRVPYCLPPDAMHDVLEKLLCLNIKVLAKGLHQKKVLQYDNKFAVKTVKYEQI